MTKKEQAEAFRAEAKVMEQSDPARAVNLRREADEIDPPKIPRADLPATGKAVKAVKTAKRKR